MTARVIVECVDCRTPYSQVDCPHLSTYQERIQRGANLFRELFKCEVVNDDTRDELCRKNLFANCPFSTAARQKE